MSGEWLERGFRDRRARGAAAALVLVLALFGAKRARADVLLLPIEHGGRLTDASSVADIAGSTGTVLHSHAAARAALIEGYGEDPPEVSTSDLSRWASSSHQAVRSLARADYDSARSALAQVEALTDRALAELNREAERSRQVLDTCLYLVRSLEETGQHGRAVEQGYACRRLVPRGEPTENQHPPEVMSILEEVDRSLARMSGVRLRVASEPSGCAVRLNGLDFGVTPLSTDDLRPGEYRIQVECGQARGRVHRLELSGAGAELRVDAGTEALLGTSPLRVRIDTEGARTLDPSIAARIARLGRIAGVEEVWLVDDASTGRRRVFSLHRIDVASEREIAVVHTSERALPLALASLRQGRSHDWTTDQEIATSESGSDASDAARPIASGEPSWFGVRPIAPTPEPTPAPPDPTSPEPEPAPAPAARTPPDHTLAHWAGGVSFALGLGAYATSWSFLGYRAAHLGRFLAIAEPTDPDYLRRQAAWLDAEPPTLAPAFVGAALWTLAIPLVFGPDDGIPAWSWLLGGVGLAGAGAGVAVALTAARCPTSVETDDACVEADAMWDAGWLIAAQTAPLLAFPITHLVRSAIGSPHVEAHVELDHAHLALGLRGAF